MFANLVEGKMVSSFKNFFLKNDHLSELTEQKQTPRLKRISLWLRGEDERKG